jgi:four helix bundle protein
MADEPVLLQHEKLDVYKIALRLQVEMLDLLPKRGHSSLRDQLDRAMASVLLNIAEGAGRRAMPDKRHFYEIARGSTTEVAAIIDLARVRGLAREDKCREGRELVIRVVQMLSRLSDKRREDA